MFGILKIKGLLIGMLLASPAVGLWMLHRTPPSAVAAEVQPISFGAVVPLPADVTRIPVEVISKGRAPEWVYVEVGNQTVPEPGAVSLLILAGAVLAFRRQRA